MFTHKYMTIWCKNKYHNRNMKMTNANEQTFVKNTQNNKETKKKKNYLLNIYQNVSNYNDQIYYPN